MLNQLCYLYNLRIYKFIPFELGSVSLKIPFKKVTNHSKEWILISFTSRQTSLWLKLIRSLSNDT